VAAAKNIRSAAENNTNIDMTNIEKSKKAIDLVLDYERKQGRNPEDVSNNRKHPGYDIKSNNRMIEVKGVGESWNTYNWQSLYRTEYECLKNNPSNFYLYIVKFIDKESDKVEGFYIIPGTELESPKFRIEVETYGISPLSKRRLSEFLQDWE
jgi:hypothetical protein